MSKLKNKNIQIQIKVKYFESIPDVIESFIKTENVMGIIEFCDKSNSVLSNIIPSSIPYLNINIPALYSKSWTELWLSNYPVTYGSIGNLHFAFDEENMFSCISRSEKGISLDLLSEKIYDEIFQTLLELKYPNLYRIWNYIPKINLMDSNETERYKSFCYGRSLSFENFSIEHNGLQFPAGTGIGILSGNISIYCLSSIMTSPVHIENPRQMPAYTYPKQYGIRPPSFARATCSKTQSKDINIYIAGTSSIIGHATHHIDNIEKQCKTIFENIEILISHENLKKYGISKNISLKDIKSLKVYIRHKKDFDIVKKLCGQTFSKNTDILYLNADICRHDLLVEIEGVV